MKKILQKIFLSMESMTTLLIVFAVAIGGITFIENDYGIEAAKALVYNARWFEVLLLLLSVNLVYNIFKYKMWRKGKLLAFTIHVSFLVILLGAATTRYVGFEGMMHIREGRSSNFIESSDAYLQVKVAKGDQTVEKRKKLLLAPIARNAFTETVRLNGDKLRVRYKDFIVNASQKVVESENGAPILELMISDHGQTNNILLKENDSVRIESFILSFNRDVEGQFPYFKIMPGESGLTFISNLDVSLSDMAGKSKTVLKAGESHVYEPLKLYSIGHAMVVARRYIEKGIVQATPTEKPKESGGRSFNALVVDVSYNGETREVSLFGGRGIVGDPQKLRIGDLEVELAYGSIRVMLPFALQLLDFQLERYPGSHSPSSYASEVILHDPEKGLNLPYRIYMNHILKHRGYRFFQSSYDQDEKGTVLSVSFDPGTPITYVGYILLMVGLMLNFLSKKSRFQILTAMVRKTQAQRAALLVLLMLLFGAIGTARAQEQHSHSDTEDIHNIDAQHAEKFGQIFVQDNQGRIKPMNTLAHEVLLKVSRTSGIEGLDADQVILGMWMLPSAWQKIDMIRVKNPVLKSIIGIPEDSKYASFADFFDPNTGNYRLASMVEAADRKRPSMRDKLDKELIKVDERLNICYYVYIGNLFRIFPLQKDANHTWVNYENAVKTTTGLEKEAVTHIMSTYKEAVHNAIHDGDWTAADDALESIKNYQQHFGHLVMPSENRGKAEIFLNRANIFVRAGLVYFLIGLVLVALGFIKIFWPKFTFKWPVTIFAVILAVAFAFQTLGLILRWYVSGHAPWSNGYESMVYIAWATLLAGLVFAKGEAMPLAATSVLAGLTLLVAHLSWMDPQITTLVPVLKSYWLMIHVSMITASYGFLGLGALLGFLTLLLFILKTKKNALRVELSIKELTMINEQTLIIGLTMLIIGNFLGAVWANESWGRYWGWDPKETWTLVTILIYSAVVHFRFVPKLRSHYIFNVGALLSFGSVVMTYFGVNYYLSGLHSYASGDPLPVPMFVYYTTAVVFLIILLSFRNRKFIAVE